eukprot:366396-Chlamydomonas_euryale.AAC.1
MNNPKDSRSLAASAVAPFARGLTKRARRLLALRPLAAKPAATPALRPAALPEGARTAAAAACADVHADASTPTLSEEVARAGARPAATTAAEPPMLMLCAATAAFGASPTKKPGWFLVPPPGAPACCKHAAVTRAACLLHVLTACLPAALIPAASAWPPPGCALPATSSQAELLHRPAASAALSPPGLESRRSGSGSGSARAAAWAAAAAGVVLRCESAPGSLSGSPRWRFGCGASSQSMSQASALEPAPTSVVPSFGH